MKIYHQHQPQIQDKKIQIDLPEKKSPYNPGRSFKRKPSSNFFIQRLDEKYKRLGNIYSILRETYIEFKGDSGQNFWIKTNMKGIESYSNPPIAKGESTVYNEILPGVNLERKLYEGEVKEFIKGHRINREK